MSSTFKEIHSDTILGRMLPTLDLSCEEKRTRCGVLLCLLVDYESRKRELQTRPTYECRSNERLKTKSEKSTRLVYTGLIGELEHLKIKTRLIDEMLTLFNDVYYESIK